MSLRRSSICCLLSKNPVRASIVTVLLSSIITLARSVLSST